MKSSASGNSSGQRQVAILAVLVLAMVLTMRGVILFSGQQHLRSDEAVVGLMAKHIVTRGERPVFLYGQSYGGGHAISAYLAAPLFALFGRSAILLTGITTTVSVISILLLWLILRRYLDEWTALAGATLYAVSPPVVYQAFLVNGGAESFCLALVALHFFLRAYSEDRRVMLNAALAGLFCGFAYYAMDYALLYVVGMIFLWAVAGRRGKWACVGIFAGAFLLGCLPLIVYNCTHDFAHVRHMFGRGPAQEVSFVAHFAGALWDALTGDLAAFFSGEIDDFKPAAVGLGSWLHAAAAIIAVLVLLYERRKTFADAARNFSLRGGKNAALPVVALPLVFIVIYMGMYCSARFSLPPLRTPRYFLPLCPFVSIALALFCLWQRKGMARQAGLALILILIARGAGASTAFGLRQQHEEHRITTSGREIRALALKLKAGDIRLALAPYEIQWRLMFETDEQVLVSCENISPLPRYRWYEHEVRRRIENGEPFALIFRKDKAFFNLARGRRKPSHETDNFIILFPLNRSDLKRFDR